MNPVFDISNVCLGYKKNDVVLKIEKFKIQSGKLVFILGKSGIGKSTLLEFFGLMNETLIKQKLNKNTSKALFHINQNKIDYLKIWQKKNKFLSTLRKKHFAFVFQSDNLMPNFTIGDNIVLSQLIKGSKPKNAINNAKRLLTKLDLKKSDFDKKVDSYSGGQRQRVSFIRAISTNFSVLFCDEPTGNLDVTTANLAIEVLKEELNNKEATALIVSHDIDLALKFADEICVIVKGQNHKDKNIGLISNKFTFERVTWEKQTAEFKNKIKNLLN